MGRRHGADLSEASEKPLKEALSRPNVSRGILKKAYGGIHNAHWRLAFVKSVEVALKNDNSIQINC